MKNKKIRECADEHGVKLWEVAEQLRINDGNLSRRLRHELPAEEQERICQLIEELAARRAG